jgi:hypothetical protein
MLCLCVVTVTWRENYGCRKSSVGDSMSAAVAAMVRDRKMLVVCVWHLGLKAMAVLGQHA